ncbi:MAG: type I methionyl aminopeptidase [Pseudomonadota bacterium]
MGIPLKSKQDIEAMRIAGHQAASVLHMIREHVVPGVTTGELDAICHAFITDELNAVPAPLNYGGAPGRMPFPKSICTSVNHVVCHGIPGDRVLKNGDIVNIDVTLIQNGWHGDTSKMFLVGAPSIKAKRVTDVAHEALTIGIDHVRPGATLGDIGHAIQRFVESKRCSVVREYCSHGIGQSFHEPPQVLHYGEPGQGVRLEEGMTFTIEPMVNLGKGGTRLLSDGWTVLTRDRSLSAQWEHTLAVTADGADVLTQLPGDAL